MVINFKITHAEVPDAVREYALKKLKKIERLLGEEGAHTVCDIELSLSAPRHSGPVHYAEVNLHTPKKLYRATAEEESFEAALDEVKDELFKELSRDRGKRREEERKGGAQAKKMLRGEE